MWHAQDAPCARSLLGLCELPWFGMPPGALCTPGGRAAPPGIRGAHDVLQAAACKALHSQFGLQRPRAPLSSGEPAACTMQICRRP